MHVGDKSNNNKIIFQDILTAALADATIDLSMSMPYHEHRPGAATASQSMWNYLISERNMFK